MTHALHKNLLEYSNMMQAYAAGDLFCRIRQEKDGGAWCPATQVASDIYEYLQITFDSLTVLTMVETQGRFGGGQVRLYLDNG